MTSISKGEVNKKLILEVAFLYEFMARCIFLLSAKMMNTYACTCSCCSYIYAYVHIIALKLDTLNYPLK